MAEVGQMLELKAAGTYSGTVTSLTYQWQRSNDGSTGWANITGETGLTYTVASSDADKFIAILETATGPGGSIDTRSAAEAVIGTPALLLETGDRLLLVIGDRLLLEEGSGSGAPTAPAQFGSGYWSVTNPATGGDITITISTLPSNGGSAITALQYQINGGSWTSLGGATTGSYGVSGLTDGVSVTVAIRAVNAIGNGTASATKSVTPSTAGSTPLPIDTISHTPPSVARPAYLVPYTDPMSGVPIIRISDDPGTQIGSISGRFWGTIVHHQYMKFAAWNCDESLLFIETNTGGSGSGGNTFLDGQTYEPLISRSRPSGWLEGRWDRTDPDTMIYITSGCQLRRHNVMANTTSLIKDFSATYSDMLMGIHEGDTNWDGNLVPFNATKISNGHTVGLCYNMDTPAIPPIEIDITASGKALAEGMVSISPLGNYILIYYDDEKQRIYSATTGALVQDWTDTETPNHATMTVDENGDEVVVGSRPGGNVIKRRLSDGTITVLNSSSYAYHTSASNYLGGLYAVTDYWADSGSPYVSEAALISLAGGVVGRLCHTQRGANIDYENEPHTSLSPLGTRAIFASTWRGSGTPSRPVGIYVADFRDFYLPV